MDTASEAKRIEDVAVTNGAEAFLAQLRASGHVRYIFGNTGTDHGPIIEALAKSQGGDEGPGARILVVPHEHAAMSMAHGYYNVSGHPQMVLVHTLPGTANALGGVMNAASSNTPVLLVAGRTPITEAEVPGGRSRPIHWRQESRDQGALVREFVKWDFENRSNANLHTVVSRAFKIAMTEPRGPVYLTLPREWLVEPMEQTRINRAAFRPATSFQAEIGALETLADMLIGAENPLIVTKFIGRHADAVGHLVALAESLAVPVVCPRSPAYMNFPTHNPLYLGQQSLKYARDADVILFIDVDVPWPNTSREMLRDDVRIAQIEMDPDFTAIPVWGFPVDHAIAGCSETSLPVLNDIVRRRLADGDSGGERRAERRKWIAAEHEAIMRAIGDQAAAARNEKPMNAHWVSRCIAEVMDENTIMVDESTTAPLYDYLPLNRPGSYFGNPPAGHLGFGLGAAIGAKLAAPERTVICAVGDGAYMFGIPTACHFTAQKYGVPFLTVVFNNQAWNATINTVREFYPEGVAASSHNFPGCDLSPSPRFELIAQSCSAWAECVEEPDELPGALRRALKVMREEGRQALLNVVCRQPI